MQDKDGNLWIGTGAGLSFLNIRQNKFTNFSVADGLNGNIFNQNSACGTENGILFFGSTSGLNIFKPGDINQSAYSPPVLITGFEIFNQPVKVDESSPLKTNIIGAKEVYPAFEQNVFSFKFSALDFNSPGSVRYAYKMEGFDKEWIYSGSRRYVTYTNLYPGTYTFKVKATNSDGIWNNRYTSLRVTIKSPWWRTEWAYVLYVSLIVLGLLAIRRFEKNRMLLRKELKMHEFEAKKQKEIDNMKSRFFANLSHEFRTPLMLIKGPLERLAFKSKDAGNDENYKLIYRNTEKLQNLIDQLLELTQLEAASIPLKAKQENLISLLRGFVSSFETLTELKGVELSLRLPEENINAWIDRDKFEKIVNNLLSNAFKFTPAGGSITVQAEKIKFKGNDFAEIKISDTGIGIPADKINKIFDRFFQVDDSSRKVYGGSGIGLSLVKELIELHKWNISVKSREYSGTEFIIRIPLSGSYLSDNEKTGGVEQNPEENNLMPKKYHGHEINSAENEDIPVQNIPRKSKEISTILIVEDSEDVRIYLSDILKHDYNILQSKNCDEGISAASENSIDLIISDIMMPGRDGIEFCREIKTNWETSHIPLILLTAKASKESKLEGLETGADDYLTKPFDSKELIVRIKNLLEQRKLLRERFSREINFKPDTSKISNIDNEFILNAIKIAETNLDNPDFDSESFAQEMFVSRSQLHRKLTALTGQAPGEFLRIVRLKKAAQLLAEKKLSITQIAFAVGFNSPSHFSKAFQQLFNCLPSEFARKLA